MILKRSVCCLLLLIPFIYHIEDVNHRDDEHADGDHHERKCFDVFVHRIEKVCEAKLGGKCFLTGMDSQIASLVRIHFVAQSTIADYEQYDKLQLR